MDPDEVEIGSVILVQPGEKVPIDGIILEGSSTLIPALLPEKAFQEMQDLETRSSAAA